MGRNLFVLETLGLSFSQNRAAQETLERRVHCVQGPTMQEEGLELLEVPLLKLDTDPETLPTITG